MEYVPKLEAQELFNLRTEVENVQLDVCEAPPHMQETAAFASGRQMSASYTLSWLRKIYGASSYDVTL